MPPDFNSFEDQLREILEHAYPLARDAVINAETIMGEINYIGMSELRDALDHLNKAFYPNFDNNDENISDNLAESYEHLRRAGVDSLERCATKEFNECLEFISKPRCIYKICFLDPANENEVRQLRRDISERIANGRRLKSSKETWEESINEYQKAVECCEELRLMFPTRNQFRFNLFALIVGLVTILSLFGNINAYFLISHPLFGFPIVLIGYLILLYIICSY